MKMTRRMKKILLVLLHPERAVQWLEKSDNTYPSTLDRLNYYSEPYIMLFCAKRSSWNFTHSEVVSYRRTFRIMKELGLIDERNFHSIFHDTYEYRACKLTAKGRQQAEKVEKDIRDLIKEYESLVD